jgi:DNA-binding response OmpR family regulator
VREVTARIRAITRRVMLANNPQTENKTLSFTLGDLVVLPDQLRARRGDKVIELSIRDIDILTVFHESNVNLITRDHLFNQA